MQQDSHDNNARTPVAILKNLTCQQILSFSRDEVFKYIGL